MQLKINRSIAKGWRLEDVCFDWQSINRSIVRSKSRSCLSRWTTRVEEEEDFVGRSANEDELVATKIVKAQVFVGEGWKTHTHTHRECWTVAEEEEKIFTLLAVVLMIAARFEEILANIRPTLVASSCCCLQTMEPPDTAKAKRMLSRSCWWWSWTRLRLRCRQWSSGSAVRNYTTVCAEDEQGKEKKSKKMTLVVWVNRMECSHRNQSTEFHPLAKTCVLF